VEIAAYYVVAEALANATKHAQASLVRIRATTDGDRFDLSIGDDGIGGADPSRGTGLLGLTDRIEALGGRITITSPRGAGTSLRVELPVDTG
jgi:signal transduction histidine kinase